MVLSTYLIPRSVLGVSQVQRSMTICLPYSDRAINIVAYVCSAGVIEVRRCRINHVLRMTSLRRTVDGVCIAKNTVLSWMFASGRPGCRQAVTTSSLASDAALLPETNNATYMYFPTRSQPHLASRYTNDMHMKTMSVSASLKHVLNQSRTSGSINQ